MNVRRSRFRMIYVAVTALLLLVAAGQPAVRASATSEVSASTVALTEGLTATASASASDTLQRLIDQAETGATVTIPAGTYAGPISITKPLALIGATDGIVKLVNSSQQSAITIEAEGVQVSGLTIIDEAVKEAPTVLVTADMAMIDALHILTGSDGIKLMEANSGVIVNNTIEWGAAHVTSFTEKGNGIDLRNSHGVRIMDNTVRGLFDAIYVEFSDDAVVTDNTVEESRYGIHSMYAKRTIIRNNIGTRNITGAMIMAASDVELTDNTFTKQSENVNSQGILLFDAHTSHILRNAVDGNRVGIYIEYSTENELSDNTVTNNFIGIQLLESSDNTITNNQFIGNVTDAMAQGNEQNTIIANYWDSFSGIDADGDGRSDIQYAINPFFQTVIQKKPAFQLFFQSPSLMFLENLFVSERTGWTTDAAPLMAPSQSIHRGTDGSHGTGGTDGATVWVTAVTGFAGILLTIVIITIFRRRNI